LVQKELKEKLKSPDFKSSGSGGPRTSVEEHDDDEDEYNTNKNNALVPANMFQTKPEQDQDKGGICSIM
jgi:hypothetical protein